MASAIILIVGDEILQGHTQDTNSHYLATRLAARGIDLARIVTIPDHVDVIAETLEDALRKTPDFIFVCGGIGPTPDDRTYEAVAMALRAPLVIQPEDERWLRARVVARGYGTGLLEDPEKAEGLLRMVRRPDGTDAIENPVGAALGTLARQGRTTVFVLPGVPRELRAMMEQVIEQKHLSGGGLARMRIELEIVGEEARLYPLLRELEMKHPQVTVGSYPQDDRGRILLRIQGPAIDAEQVASRIVGETGARPTR